MPEIIVSSKVQDGRGEKVLLRERVTEHNMASDYYAQQLMQRIGWALNDRDGAGGSSPARAREAQAAVSAEGGV